MTGIRNCGGQEDRAIGLDGRKGIVEHENGEIVEVDVCSNRGSGSLDYHYQSLLPQVAHDRQRVDANNASAFCFSGVGLRPQN